MFAMILAYMSVLDNMDLIWLFVMFFTYVFDNFELMCLS